MAKYQANPVMVDAFKIKVLGEISPKDGSQTLILENGHTVFATVEMMARYLPKVGDYWVIQSDGYIYLNPANVFQKKYSPVNFGMTEEVRNILNDDHAACIKAALNTLG